MSPIETPIPELEFIDVAGEKCLNIYMRMLESISRAPDARSYLSAYIENLAALYDGVENHVQLLTLGLRPGRFRVFKAIDAVKRGPELQTNLEDIEHELPILRGGFFGELISKPGPKMMHHLSLGIEPVTGMDLSRFGSLMTYPVYREGQVGAWIVAFRNGPEQATVDELRELMVLGNLVTSVLSNIRVSQDLREAQAQIDREVEQIAAIQRALLPETMPDIPGLSIASVYETYDRAGGDYYGFVPLKDGLWAMLIADASGHGPSAAVVVSMLHAILHSNPDLPTDPATLLEFLNRNLQSGPMKGAFVTAWIGVYDPPSRRLRYASAGHEVPILMDTNRGEKLSRLELTNGFPLGIVERVDSREAETMLEAGQTLVLYTDGITEARSPGGTAFEVEGIEAALTTCNGKPDCVTLEVLEALRDHEGGRRPQDDQTLVAVHVQ